MALTKRAGKPLTKHERQVVEAAYQVLSDDAERMGFTYSGFALTSLPHKPQHTPTWRREGHNLTLVLQAGVDRTEKSIACPMDHTRASSCCFCRVKRSDRARERLVSEEACVSGLAQWAFLSAEKPIAV